MAEGAEDAERGGGRELMDLGHLAGPRCHSAGQDGCGSSNSAGSLLSQSQKWPWPPRVRLVNAMQLSTHLVTRNEKQSR